MQCFAEYNFIVTYRAGIENRKTEALSHQNTVTLNTEKTKQSIIDPTRIICIIKADNFLDTIKTSFVCSNYPYLADDFFDQNQAQYRQYTWGRF